jgi:hypothetical protein
MQTFESRTPVESQTPVWTPRRIALAAVLFSAQAALAVAVGTQGWLANDPALYAPPIAVMVAVPPLLFLAAYAALPGFRSFVLAQDMRLLTLLHTFRMVGFGFIVLWSYDVLPALFAWAAGAGDMLVAMGAAAAVWAMMRDPDADHRAALARVHRWGLIDFAGAVGAASLTTGAIAAFAPGGVTSLPMSVWPLNLFPSLFVPTYIVTHLAVFLKLRALRRAEADRPFGAVPVA